MSITGAASMRITDYGALRVRAGVELGNFLPYARLGVAVGRADVYRSATAFGTGNRPGSQPADPVITPFFFTENESKQGAVIYGWSAGGGIDIMLMPNFFVRAEYEYMASTALDIKSSISTGRLGAGFKF